LPERERGRVRVGLPPHLTLSPKGERGSRSAFSFQLCDRERGHHLHTFRRESRQQLFLACDRSFPRKLIWYFVTMKIDIPSHLSDDDLVAQVKSLARCEREATASLLAYLGELDARRLYLGAGFSSLFTYCCDVLHLSEPAAYNRIEAARAARRFPAILRMLGEGSLSLATVRLLASILTAENHQEL